jgi:dihydroorotase
MLTWIKGGRIVDPGNIDSVGDIWIENDRIGKIVLPVDSAKAIASGNKPDRIIDAVGKIVVPGLIDMHVHLREPGQEYKETIESGSRAAAAGGFTTICCMPNTQPVNDNRQVTEFILREAVKAGAARVLPVGAISKGIEGRYLSEYGELKEAGVVALSDDGHPVRNSLLMRRAMEYAKGFGLFLISHCEDLDLTGNGVMNEGETATRMGLSGIPNAAETIMVMREIALCDLTKIPVHLAHISTAQSVDVIRDAKNRGIPVTAETAPHYFSLTDDAVKGYNTHAKMNPPLRTEEDRRTIRKGLADGTIDVIATDHAPHSDLEKDVEFDMAANGIIGLETSLSLSLKLVEDGILTLAILIEKMSKNPARILGIKNDLLENNPAYITIIDPEKTYLVDAKRFYSKSRNTPFDGWRLKGKAVLTMVGGRIVYEEM